MIDSVLAWALRYIRLGWAVFPVELRVDRDGKVLKQPMIQAWQVNATLDEAKVREWWTRWPKAGIGIRTGDRFFMVDVDLKSGGQDDLDFLVEQYGRFDTLQQITGTGGYHFLFEMPDFAVRNIQGAQTPIFGPGIDIRGVGGYMVACPSWNPQTKRFYCWDGADEIEQQLIARAPAWMLERLKARRPNPEGWTPAPALAEAWPKGQRHRGLVSLAGTMRQRGLTAAEMLPTLLAANRARCNPPYDEDHIRQIADSMEKYPPGKLSFRAPRVPAAADVADGSRPAAEVSLSAADIEAAVDAVIGAKDLAAATRLAPEIGKLKPVQQEVVLVRLREAFGGAWRARSFARAMRGDGDDDMGASGPIEEDDGDLALARPPHTEAGNADRIVALYGDHIRYCKEMNKWLLWDGKRWQPDTKDAMAMVQKAVEMAREMYRVAVKNGDKGLQVWARISESLRVINASLRIAQGCGGIPVSTTQLDSHEYLLNCPNGVVDLCKGELLKHNKNFLITKLCPIEYHPSAKAPTFMAFIEWAMGGRSPESDLTEKTRRMMGFLQRAFGYALTSDVSEKVLFICHGKKGNNGKTTLLNLFRAIMGDDYTGQIDIKSVMATKTTDAGARADLADLRGCRLVVTSEVDKEDRLNVAKIKAITAGLGAKVKARRLFENPMEFIATHKLFMDCNHRPRVNDADDAIWNRLRLVPFLNHVSHDEMDLDLPNKMFAEAQGVLAWAVRGSQNWYKRLREGARGGGLGVPPEVKGAGEEWRDEDDPLRDFLEDCCSLEDIGDDKCFTPVGDMRAAYDRWAKDDGQKFTIGPREFNDRMEQRGIVQSRGRVLNGKKTRCWEGITMRGDLLMITRERRNAREMSMADD